MNHVLMKRLLKSQFKELKKMQTAYLRQQEAIQRNLEHEVNFGEKKSLHIPISHLWYRNSTTTLRQNLRDLDFQQRKPTCLLIS